MDTSNMDLILDMMPDDNVVYNVLEEGKTNEYYQGQAEYILKKIDTSEHYFHFVHTILKNAKDKFGWKLVPAIAGIEVFEHAILPQLLVTLTGNPAFYVIATIPTLEILAATALAIAKSKLPKKPEEEPPPGHLDWYETGAS